VSLSKGVGLIEWGRRRIKPHLGRVRFQLRPQKPSPNISLNSSHSKVIIPTEIVAIKLLDAIILQPGYELKVI
jgi:hypothetical protein